MTLEISNLTGGYMNRPVLKNVSFTVEKGEIVGLIGLNGAGKSTTIKHIMGLLHPFSGSIAIDGKTFADDSLAYRKKLAMIPETPIIYPSLTLREHLEMIALAYDIDEETILKRATPLLEKFRLKRRMDWFPKDFSKGMKQKVMIMTALVTQPDILIVDEPFVGLDPVAIMDFEQILLEQTNEGKSVLMSTHILANAEKLCDAYVILNQGEVYAKGTLEELVAEFDLKEKSLEEVYRYMVQNNKKESRMDNASLII